MEKYSNKLYAQCPLGGTFEFNIVKMFNVIGNGTN